MLFIPLPSTFSFFLVLRVSVFLLSLLLSITLPSELLPEEREREKKPSITSARVAFPCFVLVCGDATRSALSLRAEMKYFIAVNLFLHPISCFVTKQNGNNG